MAYILTKDRPNNSREEWQSGWSAYSAYLRSVKDHLPQSAYEFATAPWHYNFEDHRSPHDGWLESATIRELTSADERTDRSMEINVRLFAAYHDGHIELNYSNVRAYSLAFKPGTTDHGDWLYDEIRLSDERHVFHEVEWSRGGLWLIECGDVIYEWLPLESARAAS